VVEIDSKK